jgi:hypothetical protein
MARCFEDVGAYIRGRCAGATMRGRWQIRYVTRITTVVGVGGSSRIADLSVLGMVGEVNGSSI